MSDPYRPAPEFFQKPAQGHKGRQRNKEITDAVHQIIGDTGDPRGDHHVPSPHGTVDGDAQKPEQQSEGAGQDGPGEPSLHRAHEVRRHRQEQPDIQIHQIPEIEPVYQHLQHHIHVDGIQCLSAVDHRHEHDHEGHRFDIGKRCHGHLSPEGQSGQDAHFRQLAKVRLHDASFV